MREKRLALYRWRLSVQEAERTRIARELHDNIGQSLTLLGIELESVRVSVESPDVSDRLKVVSARMREIGLAVSELSHQVYSSELELLGLGTALTSLCAEFAERNGVTVACNCTDAPGDVGKELALTLFRVCEQTLESFAKHNDLTKVDVKLRGTHNSISLMISSDVVALDASSAVELLFADMKERMQLSGGRLISRRGKTGGIKIEVGAPLAKRLT